MSLVADLSQEITAKGEKPAYVEFTMVAKHLPMTSEKEGRYIAVDVEMVTVRQLGAADSAKFEVKQWLENNKREVRNGRLPAEHAAYYEKAYQRWKLGQEMPLQGTPIKGWAVISPAQAEMLIKMGIRTVEELSTINDEGRARIGMGAVTITNKAKAWLAQAEDKGPLTMQMAAVQQQNEQLSLTVAQLTERLDALTKQQPAPQHVESLPSALEILEDEAPPQRRPGRPRKDV